MRNKILTRVETFFLLVRPRALPSHNVGPRWEPLPVQIDKLLTLMHRGSFQAEQWEFWRQVELWLVLWVSSELARPLNLRTILALQTCWVDGIFLFSSFFWRPEDTTTKRCRRAEKKVRQKKGNTYTTVSRTQSTNLKHRYGANDVERL